MKWKTGVEILRENGTWLKLGDKKKKVSEEDECILKLMEKGIKDDDRFLKYMTEITSEDSIGAGLRLAQFVEDYGDFLMERKKDEVFG
ncbi:hypothetical protein UYO_2075 [Lachnospiraceae bacterium JC7]|nr:hypothetical protein UYO_2075 [Lachnospiraceae bacterium JC7]